MQLGTRWAPGTPPPARLPEAVIAAIHEVEQSMGQTLAESGRRWTLTWLEGRPIVELDAEAGTGHVTKISLAPGESAATITTGDPDEEWVEEGL